MYKRQEVIAPTLAHLLGVAQAACIGRTTHQAIADAMTVLCLLYTSDAADERSSVDLGGRRLIKKKNNEAIAGSTKIRNKKTTTNR